MCLCRPTLRLSCLSGSANTKLSTYPKEWFDGVEMVAFEDMQMPLPVKAHEIAEQRFGYRYAIVPWGKRSINKNVQRTDLSNDIE